MNLPYSEKLNIGALQHLFDNMSECYKLFWFKSIIDNVFKDKIDLTYSEIIDGMIADAWYMVTEYRLNLGPNDTLEKLVKDAQGKLSLQSSAKREDIIKKIQDSGDSILKDNKKTLTLNVPYRLQAPFLKSFNWGVSTKKLAENINEKENLIYTFTDIAGVNSKIRIDEDWANYIKQNYIILSSWIKYNMICYLQRRNPSVPGIPNKLEAPQSRDLTIVQNLWKAILGKTDVYEIYEGKKLDGKISIDHFVPWSYVTHDELWNLSPTTQSINSTKGNRLPSFDLFFSRFAKLQYMAVELKDQYTGINNLFNKCLEKNMNDQDILYRLYINKEDRTTFCNKLQDVVYPVYNSAKNMGFQLWDGSRN